MLTIVNFKSSMSLKKKLKSRTAKNIISRYFQAKLWVQVIKEFANGIKLKKVQECFDNEIRRQIEYELTPYELLMDDIRSRRYKLKPVTVDGQIPHRIQKDAHAIILEFIRSRPPLKKASFTLLRCSIS